MYFDGNNRCWDLLNVSFQDFPIPIFQFRAFSFIDLFISVWVRQGLCISRFLSFKLDYRQIKRLIKMILMENNGINAF